MKKQILTVFLTGTLSTFAQMETAIWHFGAQCALDFTNGTPQWVPGSSISTGEGCASVADVVGNLLFYTNGETIWNKNNQVMANGTGLTGSNDATQSSLIVRRPGSNSFYYVFTMGNAGNGDLSYSEVDMTLASGMGSVTTKNNLLATGMTEKLAGTKHCNGIDVWAVSHLFNSDKFLSFRITSAGVNTSAVVSQVGSYHSPTSNPIYENEFAGYLRFSSNGKKMASVVTSYSMGLVELFDFNPATGHISNPSTLGKLFVGYGCEFSPDGHILYATALDTSGYYSNIPSRELIHWNLCAANDSLIGQTKSRIRLDTVPLGALSLGLDGKIYDNFAGTTKNHIGVISKPNQWSGNGGYQAIGPFLNGYGLMGLPNFVSNLFREKPSYTHTATCYNANFSLPDLCGTGYVVNGLQWQFGDPGSGAANTSTLAAPSHVYPAAGDYTATLLLQYNCGSDTIVQVVHINVPQLQVTGPGTVCAGNSVILSASGANTYFWSSGQQTSSISLTPTASTVFTVTGTNTLSCSSSHTVSLVYSLCLGLDETKGNPAFHIFPNPAKSSLHVSAALPCRLRLHDIRGKVLQENELSGGENQISIEGLSAGLYFAELREVPGAWVKVLVE
jgi:hypothetical protein